MMELQLFVYQMLNESHHIFYENMPQIETSQDIYFDIITKTSKNYLLNITLKLFIKIIYLTIDHFYDSN